MSDGTFCGCSADARRRSMSSLRQWERTAPPRKGAVSHHGGRASSQTKIAAHIGGRWVIASTPAAHVSYRLTDDGLAFGIFYTKVHDWLPKTGTATDPKSVAHH
jgi:hypothetical protein